MEMLAIVLSVPASFVLSAVYSVILAKMAPQLPRLASAIFRASHVVLGLFLVEILVLFAMGPVGARTLMGPWFEHVSRLLFVLGVPALATSLVLVRRPVVSRWFAVAPICSAFALVLVLTQYEVSEALYGVDGMGGPFGHP